MNKQVPTSHMNLPPEDGDMLMCFYENTLCHAEHHFVAAVTTLNLT
jgi:hypothetical protein